jgi:hypothetical protein
MSRHARAPIYTAAFDLADWVLGHFNTATDRLSADICRLALRLLDNIVLALADQDALDALDRADIALAQLRQRLRLAERLALLDERQLLHGLARCDDIGRQIGGWLRSLDAPQ